jgi:hypothetical protein
VTNYWNEAKVAEEGGSVVRINDAYSKKNLRFYLSDKPIATMSTGIAPQPK